MYVDERFKTGVMKMTNGLVQKVVRAVIKDPVPVALIGIGVADLARTETFGQRGYRPGMSNCYKTTLLFGVQQGSDVVYLTAGEMAKRFPGQAALYSNLESTVNVQGPKPKC